MHLAPAKTLTFTDPATGAVLYAAPTPCLAQIEACIRLEPESADSPESPVQRQRRLLAQCLVLLCPPMLAEASPVAWGRAWLRRRRARRWLLSLQYPQLLDLYRKLMLAVQGIDFESVEEFEAALLAQKKSTDNAPPKAAPTSSPVSTS